MEVDLVVVLVQDQGKKLLFNYFITFPHQLVIFRSRSRSGSGSRHSRSRSGSSKRSGSGSPSSKRSGSGSPGSKHSGSASPTSRKSGSGSPASKRSRSGSRDSNASGGVEKRKRKILSDSDSDSDGPKQSSQVKKNKLIDTDDESDDEKNQSQPAAGDIFGDADDISSDEEAKSEGSAKRKSRSGSEASRRSVSRSRSRSRGRSRSGSRSDDDERKSRQKSQEREKTPIPETRIDVEIPRIVADLGKDIHFVKLPNFLSVDTRPFDPETYEDEIDEEETLDEEGRQRLKLKVGNTMRWRRFINDKGETVQESNARFVKWSDGSMSLYLGSEIFDVMKQPLQNDYNHLFIRQGTGLQGQAVFRTKLTFRPHSTDSLTHKKMTISLADRSQKTAGIKILTQVGHDPEADRNQNLKKEEESLRQLMRQRKPVKKRSKRTSATGYENPDEGSEEEGAISIAAIKNKYKKGAAGGSDKKPIYSSDDNDDASDGSDFDTRRNKKDKSRPTKALKDSDDEESGGEASGSEKSGSGKDSGGSGSDKSDQSDEDDD